MTKKAQTIAFCVSSFALPIIIYLVNVFLSDYNFIDYYSSNIDLFLISFIGGSIILESIIIFILRKKLVSKYIIMGLSAFIISLSLIIAFYIWIGFVFADLAEAISQYDN